MRKLQKYIQKIERECHENVFLMADRALSKFNFLFHLKSKTNLVTLRKCNSHLQYLPSPEEKFYSNLRNRFFNFISSIQGKNIFRTIINLFDFKKSCVWPFLNERNYFFIII